MKTFVSYVLWRYLEPPQESDNKYITIIYINLNDKFLPK